jgi:3-methyladenine DNA glycosylase Tag
MPTHQKDVARLHVGVEGDPLLRAYHDTEWGVSKRSGRTLSHIITTVC